jgi:hypothetical protein
MSKEFVEPEEKELNGNIKDAEVIDDFNPLGEPVNEKEYTKHNVRINPNDFATDIPEPSFMPPPMSETMTQEQKVKKPIEPMNPEMKDMPKKDKHDAAEKVAEMIITGYKFAWGWADTKLLFDENKVMQMQRDGEIDLSIQMDVAPNVSMSAGEFIEEYNSQSKGTLVVTDEFVEDVMPPLVRVLEKRGIGMSDEQYLMYAFGKHTLTMGMMGYQSLSVKKQMLEYMKEQTSLLRQGVRNTPPPPQPTRQQSEPKTTPTPPPPSEEIVEEFVEEDYSYPESNGYEAPNVNEIVNKMTGAEQPTIDSEYKEVEKPNVTIIDNGSGSKKGKGRPKKK